MEQGEYLQFRTWWAEEAQNTARRNIANNVDITVDHLLAHGQWAGVQSQLQYDDVTIIQVRLGCLKAWDKVESPGRTGKSFVKIQQNLGEPYTDFKD